MARARSIKPGFFKNERLSELPPHARLLFAGLWTIADRAGRLEDRPKRIKAEVFPYENPPVDRLLSELDKYGFITRYEANGTRYIAIPAWNKHQNPHIKEAASTIPAPYEHSAQTGNSGTSPSDSLNPVTGTLNLEPGAQPRSMNGVHAPDAYRDLFDGKEPLEWLESVFTGEWMADTWRAFPKYVNTPEQAKALRDNTPLWMATRKWRDGFGTNSVKYLQGGVWLKPPNKSLMVEDRKEPEPQEHHYRDFVPIGMGPCPPDKMPPDKPTTMEDLRAAVRAGKVSG